MSIPAPLPRIRAFEKLGYGLFLHWGLHALVGRGVWGQAFTKTPPAEYEKLMERFTAEEFDANEIAAFARRAGMRYITLTLRHHDGFSLYDTCGLNTYDAPHSAAKRDLAAEFVAGCRKHGIVPFFYHTTIDWHWRGGGLDPEGKSFVNYAQEASDELFREYLDYLHTSVELLCRNYGPVGGFWFDGNWARPGADWQEDRLYGMIRKYQPDAVIINNTGLQALGKTGHPELDAVTYENNAAKPLDREGMKKYVAAEVCRPMNSFWGRGKKAIDYLSPAQVVEELCRSRGCGANLLLNVAPTAEGQIPPYEKAALEEVGRWVGWFGEALFDPRPAPELRCRGRDFILRDGKKLYYFAFGVGVSWQTAGPELRTIDGLTEKISACRWLDDGVPLDFTQDTQKKIASFRCSEFLYGEQTVVRVARLDLE